MTENEIVMTQSSMSDEEMQKSTACQNTDFKTYVQLEGNIVMATVGFGRSLHKAKTTVAQNKRLQSVKHGAKAYSAFMKILHSIAAPSLSFGVGFTVGPLGSAARCVFDRFNAIGRTLARPGSSKCSTS